MRFYTTEQIGSKRAYTPEGFLVAQDVPIARIGTQIYSNYEVGFDGNPDAAVRIQRDPEEVFRPESIASWSGKPVLNDHPEDGGLITPQNWRKSAVGVVLHPRRGEGEQHDLLLADLKIYDPDAIAAVNDGKREVSGGYDCQYEDTGDGRGRQVNIVGNHVALVDRGRCGPRCAIGDSERINKITADAIGDIWGRAWIDAASPRAPRRKTPFDAGIRVIRARCRRK